MTCEFGCKMWVIVNCLRRCSRFPPPRHQTLLPDDLTADIQSLAAAGAEDEDAGRLACHEIFLVFQKYVIKNVPTERA